MYNMNLVRKRGVPTTTDQSKDSSTQPVPVDIAQDFVVKRYSHFRDLHTQVRNNNVFYTVSFALRIP